MRLILYYRSLSFYLLLLPLFFFHFYFQIFFSIIALYLLCSFTHHKTLFPVCLAKEFFFFWPVVCTSSFLITVCLSSVSDINLCPWLIEILETSALFSGRCFVCFRIFSSSFLGWLCITDWSVSVFYTFLRCFLFFFTQFLLSIIICEHSGSNMGLAA